MKKLSYMRLLVFLRRLLQKHWTKLKRESIDLAQTYALPLLQKNTSWTIKGVYGYSTQGLQGLRNCILRSLVYTYLHGSNEPALAGLDSLSVCEFLLIFPMLVFIVCIWIIVLLNA